jgi:hypothetical protein
VPAPAPSLAARARFLKGQIHVHTGRSYDARTPPAEVVRFYRDRGYDFLAITDHNLVTTAEPLGELLLVPGIELSQNSATCDPGPTPGYRCLFHLSGLFLDPARDARRGGRIPLTFRPGRLDAYRAELEIVTALDGVPVLNHPLFHFAADARVIRALSESGVRHVELWNASLDQQHPGSRARAEERAEALWDEALAQGARVFGVATDDAHHFSDAAERARVGKFAYVGDRAWIMVRAEKTVAALREAFVAGDFYATTGVTLAALDAGPRSLSLEVAAVPGETYTVRFVGKGGRELSRVEGPRASRDLGHGDGWVRAVVESSRGAKAWTQPVWEP